MSSTRNIQSNRLERLLGKKVRDNERVVKQMRAPQTIFVIPQLASDPAAPQEGQMWENIGTKTLKIYINGAVQTITIP